MTTTSLSPIDAAYAYTTIPVSLSTVPSAHPTCNAEGGQGLKNGSPICQVSGQDEGAYQAMKYCCNKNNPAHDIPIVAYAGRNDSISNRNCGLLCVLNTTQLGYEGWHDCFSGNLNAQKRNATITFSGCNGYTPKNPGEAPRLGGGSRPDPSVQKVWIMMTGLAGIGFVLGAM